MSQMVTRKRTGEDDRDKDSQRQTDSPVKDMKKKMAANAEKEKNLADKPTEKTEKPARKPADKPAEKPAEKTDKPKPADKHADKTEKSKPAEKVPEKPAEKKTEKPAERKSDAQSEKKKEDSKGESSGKTEKPEPKKHDAREKPVQNGGGGGVNGTVSGAGAGDSDSDELVIDENDEMFPELAYDDSDVEWEPGMDAPGRSLTRRSQVKATRTPETPRPASGKLPEDESKDSKVLKLNHDSGKAGDSSKPDRKPEKTDAKKPETRADTRRDSPKPDANKMETRADATKESPKSDAKKAQGERENKVEATKDVQESPRKGGEDDKSDNVEVEVEVDIETISESPEESRKPDTNYSKSRVKVSPYRRSTRLADLTTSSVAANYTGNNTTMEMDITGGSSLLEHSLDDSSYLSGLRSIRARRSYKPLADQPLRRGAAHRSARSTTTTTTASEHSRPTGTVVGRKRKPDASPAGEAEGEAEGEAAGEAAGEAGGEPGGAGKRQRLLPRLARPFRRTLAMPAGRNAEIVGINTDLPLTAPVASPDTFDPESLKPEAPLAPLAPPLTPCASPEDSKRCVIM